MGERYAVVSPDQIQTSTHATIEAAKTAAAELSAKHWIGKETRVIDVAMPDGHPRRVVARFERIGDGAVEINP